MSGVSGSTLESDKPVYSSGNNVYEACGLISRLPMQLESMTGFDNYVIVGARDGHLLIYKVTFRNTARLHADIEIMLSNKSFASAIGPVGGRKNLLQMDVIPEHKVLIALTSDGISTHDISAYHCKFISLVEKTKGASIFALNIQRQTSLTGAPSVTVRMCVAINRTLQFYYWKNRKFIELRDDLSVPDMPKALAWCQEVILLGFKNEYCQLSLLSGKQQDLSTKGKGGEPLITTVSDSEYSVVSDKQSFLFQLVKSESRNVVVVEETDGKERNAVITWSEHPLSLVYDEPYFIGVLPNIGVEIRTAKPKLKVDLFPIPTAKLICRTKGGLIFLASTDSLWVMRLTSVESQMDLFVKQNHFELALGLCNIWHEVPSEKQKKIAQIKNLFAFNLFCKKKFKEAMTIFMELGTDASHVIGLFPGLLPPDFRVQIDYPGPVPELRGADFDSGMNNLIMFLTNSRTVLLANSSQTVTESASIVEGASIIKSKKQLLQIIDTTLLKCYLESRESLIPSLLRLKDNHCHIEESERALIKAKKYNELIILYQTKGIHRRALETLQNLGDYDRMVEYLQRLGHEEMDLILEFATPIIREHPTRGIRIFTEDIQEVDQLNRSRVFDYISKNFPKLKILYLEHLVYVWDDHNALFHNALANEYRDRHLEEEDPGKKTYYLEKFRDFLVKSPHYSAQVVLVQFPYDCLFEERTMVLERLGRHDQVLALYVAVLKQPDRAMEYCRTVYESNDAMKHEVFVLLIRMFLFGPTPTLLPGVNEYDFTEYEPDVPSAMKLLQEYAPYLDPIQVLTCLPDDIEMNCVHRFVMTSVQNRLSEKRKYLIHKGLVRAEFFRATEDKRKTESEYFSVNDSTTCVICRKKISQHAFVYYPNGSVVHISCQPGSVASVSTEDFQSSTRSTIESITSSHV